MNQQQHMTKTEAHPYHRGRGIKVYDPLCPRCRDGTDETTYIGWSLHQEALRSLARRLESLAVSYSNMMATAEGDWKMIREGQAKAMKEASEIARRACEGSE